MKLYPLMRDFRDPALRVAMPRAPRMVVGQELASCPRRIKELSAEGCPVPFFELYYDLKQGRHDVGYISKGWNDPGFRVGDLVSVSKENIGNVQANAYRLLKFCATRGVVLAVEEKADSIELQMDSVIYSDGFNKSVFAQVLHYLNACVEKAQELIG